MTDLSKTREKAAETGSNSELSFWPAADSQALENWARSSASMMKGAVELAQEIMTFSQSRLRADIEGWSALAACRNPADLLDCQRQFGEKAVAQYLDETSRLMSRVAGIVAGATSPSQRDQT